MALFYPSWLSNTPVCACMCESESHSVVSNSLPPHGLYTVHGILQARILEWVAVPFSRGSSQPKVQITSPALQADSLPAEPQESPRIPEWIAYSFSGRSSWPRNWTGVSCIAGGFFTSWATREARVYVCVYTYIYAHTTFSVYMHLFGNIYVAGSCKLCCYEHMNIGCECIF